MLQRFFGHIIVAVVKSDPGMRPSAARFGFQGCVPEGVVVFEIKEAEEGEEGGDGTVAGENPGLEQSPGSVFESTVNQHIGKHHTESDDHAVSQSIRHWVEQGYDVGYGQIDRQHPPQGKTNERMSAPKIEETDGGEQDGADADDTFDVQWAGYAFDHAVDDQ